jgi:hypothetical protein
MLGMVFMSSFDCISSGGMLHNPSPFKETNNIMNPDADMSQLNVFLDPL